MNWGRGDVVVAIDPFSRDEPAGRPFLIINRDETPFHGDQYITLSLTTRTWHEERIPLADDHWSEGGAPESSSIMPWSVNSIKRGWIDYRQGTLRGDIVTQAVSQLTDYIE
jgi:mRNA interferase MazF